MLYKNNAAPFLTDALFENPTAEYRDAPFWAWNCRLDKQELMTQIERFTRMGMGGFHMHVRTGMDTPYLSDAYMDLIKACVSKAKSEGLLAYLYDEDRWPSGAAGGYVTRDPAFRMRYLLFTHTPYGQGGTTLQEVSGAKGSRTEEGKLIACYDVRLSEEGCLLSAERIPEDAPARFDKWYAYVESPNPSGWYNNQTYVNTLDKKAIDRFIDITYESYNRTIQDEFDKTVPSIFTDEPQFSRKGTFRFAASTEDVTLPWSDDLPDTFREAYGEDLLSGIPELFWDLPDGKVSLIRYHYHDHICERFTRAFADNCGAWCRSHGLKLTGHMMQEPTLYSQTGALGEAMRSYRAFDLPGIDMLCALHEYTTAKQAQSAVHQFGYEGMTCELDGVTNWDFDFRGHKLHGDWQAALGVTLRVPHLAWVSMAGEAKRDYPASINYQSPWWSEYKNVSDHFARVATALTRGKPLVKVAVIHPIESYWLHWGPEEQTALIREQLDTQFKDVTSWLLFGGIDFDFISESLLPDLCPEPGNPLKVGKMSYDAVIVPGCETLRSTTLDRLEGFKAAGGRLIFMGDAPLYENARPSERGKALYDRSGRISFSRACLLSALEKERLVELRGENGALTDHLLYQLRQDGEYRWLFIARGKDPVNPDVCRNNLLRIRLAGCWKPVLYNTLTGKKEPMSYKAGADKTELRRLIYEYDSLLIRLEPAVPGESLTLPDAPADFAGTPIAVPAKVDFALSEKNALLLDKARFRLDDEPWQPEEEILRLDNQLREVLGWPGRRESLAQPWVLPEVPAEHTVSLRFTVTAQSAIEKAFLAIEDAEKLSLLVNGQPVPVSITGWYADKSIKTIALPGLRKGENTLEVTLPFARRSNLEWAYLLGDFGVKVSGSVCEVIPLPEKATFGSFIHQGFPFYGGNFTYRFPIDTKAGEHLIRLCHYRGALTRVKVDGEDRGAVILPPYQLSLGCLTEGRHEVEITLYGHRRNAFGPVHLADLKETWIGPDAWRSRGDRWTNDYRLCEEGLLSAPEIIKL